jgi:hypothetical protein
VLVDGEALKPILDRVDYVKVGLQGIRLVDIKTVLETVVLTGALATLLAVVVVFALSLRLREKELVAIFHLGCSRRAIAGFVAAEIILIAAASVLLCGFLLGAAVLAGRAGGPDRHPSASGGGPFISRL